MRTFTRIIGLTDTAEFWARLQAQTGRLAFDVGANIGQAAAVLAQNFERVVSFEPMLEVAVDLAAHAADNVTVLPVAASDHDGMVRLDETADGLRFGMLTSGEHPRWGGRRGHRAVPCVTLDTAAEHVGRPDVVKIDVEGHELKVLAGAARLIQALTAVWLIEVHYPLEREMHKIFDGYTFTVYPHQPDHFYIEAVP